ncbi:MAG: LysM peptidoglycan-binding domain-containing protein [Caldilineaceae bacterium]
MQRNHLKIFALVFIILVLGACTRERTEATPGPTDTPLPTGMVNLVTPEPKTSNTIGEPKVTIEAKETALETPQEGITATVTAEKPTQQQWTVLPGDSLDSIAIKFGTDSATLRRLNYLQNDDIRVGQVLVVPYIEPTPTPTAAPFYHEVQAGDSLSSIAAQYNADPAEILKANQLSDANVIQLGQKLLIPGYDPGREESAPSEDTAGSTTADANATDVPDDVVIHVVQPGEGLYDIAAKYKVDAQKIATANNIANPNLIRAGQKLLIPGLTPEEVRRLRYTIHVVQSGDTLLSIAQQYNVSAEEIATANNITDPNALRVGQELIIPQ